MNVRQGQKEVAAGWVADREPAKAIGEYQVHCCSCLRLVFVAPSLD